MNLIFLLVTGCVIQLFPAHAVDLNTYLDEKLRQTKIELIKIHIRETSPVQEKSYKLHWDRLWRVPVTSEHRPFTINIFNGTFILDDDRVMEPFVNSDASSNETLKLHEVYRIGQYRTVKFLRSIVWRNTTTYILICYELDLCNLHTAMRDGPLRFRHTIEHQGKPVDAQFFTQGDWLCLVIANNADKFVVPSMIYRWSGTYMDVVSEVMTIGAESVTAFEHRQSTIIVFAQNGGEKPWISSEVYEFKDNNIVRIQFLSTTRPISVHHYLHGDFNFILMINELEPSSVLCWDGRELLDWFSLPEILPHSLIRIFYLDGSTFVVVARDQDSDDIEANNLQNIVQLYKFHSTSDWKTEDIKYLKDDQKIIDIAVSMNGYTMSVMLMIEEINKIVYWVEQWEAEITSVTDDSSMQDADATRKCLSDLIEILQERMPAVKEAEASWKLLPAFADNSTVLEPVSFDNLNLQSSVVDILEIATEEENILPPHQIQQALNDLDFKVDDVLSKWQGIINMSVTDMLTGKTMVNDVFLDEFEVDRVMVDFVNDVDVRSKKMILQDEQEDFEKPLNAKNIIIHDLEVDSLCGIPFQHWTFRNDTTNILAAANGPIEYSNGTIIMHSDLTVQRLSIKSLNGTVIDELIDGLFLLNRNQKIKGKITYERLKVENLFTQVLNDVPVEKLVTVKTNQSFDNFSVDILWVNNLHAKTINGVPVENAALKSRENVIRGKINLAKLRVIKDFKIDVKESMVKIPNPLQLYENVTILGDLYLHNVKVGKTAKLFLEDVPVNISDMFDNYWTKSTNQTITEDVTFENGLTMDSLNTKYLNGFVESDFLYTTTEEISSEFTNLHFKNFHVDGSFVRDGYEVNYFNVEPNLITINEKLHLSRLQSKDIITRIFNGISIDNILNGTVANFSGTSEFLTIQARRVFVDNLNVRFLNNRELHFIDGLRIDDDHQIDTLKVPEFHVRNLEVKSLNGIEMSLLKQLKHTTSSQLDRLVIDGDLVVENLTIHQIDGQSVESFFEELARNTIVIREKKIIDDLVVQNITLEALNDQNFNDFIKSVLVKSSIQTISGIFLANAVTSDNITANFINGQNTSQLMWVDQPLTFTGNVTFTDLFVEGDVITSTMNGRNVYELYESLSRIPAKKIDLLKVDGNVLWNVSSQSPDSISYLLKNAVTKDTDQVIEGKVIFEKDVRAWAVNGQISNITDEIRSIISDAVIDHGESPIEISGSKLFEDDLVVNTLTVKGDIGISVINHINIHKFNNSVLRKDHELKIDSPLIFRKNIKVERLRVNNPDLNASISDVVRIDDVMPDNVFFENLNVLRNVYLKNLDGVDFDEFKRNRITLDGNHDILCNMRFNGVVTVTGNANIEKINGIIPSDIVLNGINETQVISGVKTFANDLIVEGDVTVKYINDVDVTIEYEEGVQNDKDVDIYGDLVFKTDVWVKNITTFDLVNNMKLHSDVNFTERTNKTLQSLKDHWRTIAQDIDKSSRVSEISHDIFFYLEVEENLMVPAFNINNVDVLYFKETTKLYMSSEYPGSLCGLPDECPCSRQFVIELSDNVKLMRPGKPGEVVKNFYYSDGISVNVVTDAVSSSKKCTSTRIQEELIVVSLMKLENGDYRKIELSIDVSDETAGYWKDATTFEYHDEIYIFLAVYYNKAQATHGTNSLLYKIDVAGEKLMLIQKIFTDGAWTAWTFKIGQNEIFLLVGCVGESSKSLLYRFDEDTQKLKPVRIFASRSRYVRSMSQGEDHFVLLDNPDTKAIDIYKYNRASRNFQNYQSIFHIRQINGIEFFHVGEFGNSDVFVIVTTEGGFYIYEYMFAGKFQMRMQHAVDGLQTMVPFYYADHHYIFAGTYGGSTIFRIVKQGPH